MKLRQMVCVGLTLGTLVFVCGMPAEASIVNTLRGFSDGEPGWSGGISGSYDASGGNTDESTFRGSAQLQWEKGDELFRLLGSGKRTTSNGDETARALLAHLRHNHSLSQRWSTVSFLQAQENPFQRLKSRTLVGLGLRFDIVHEADFDLAWGAATMWERERLEGEDGHTSYQRLSTFLTMVKDIRQGISLDGLFFYQPDWGDFNDFRMMGKIDLNIELVGSLTLFTGFKLEHDSRPPTGVEKSDWDTTTGFKASF